MLEEPLSFNEIVDAITEFIEVAIHTILYVRQIYPAEIFVRRKKYDTPVFQSRHPALNEYISGAVKAIGDELLYGKVDKVVIVIKDKQEVALERFIISVDYAIPDVHNIDKTISAEMAISASSLIQYFRGFMVKLGMIESQIGQLHLGEEVSFAIVMELKDDEAPVHSDTKDDPPQWIPATTQHTTAGAEKKARLHMIRAVNTGIIDLSLGVQESADKVKRLEEARKAAKKRMKDAKEAKEAKEKAQAEKEKAEAGANIPQPDTAQEAATASVGGEESRTEPAVPPTNAPPQTVIEENQVQDVPAETRASNEAQAANLDDVDSDH